MKGKKKYQANQLVQQVYIADTFPISWILVYFTDSNFSDEREKKYQANQFVQQVYIACLLYTSDAADE